MAARSACVLAALALAAQLPGCRGDSGEWSSSSWRLWLTIPFVAAVLIAATAWAAYSFGRRRASYVRAHPKPPPQPAGHELVEVRAHNPAVHPIGPAAAGSSGASPAARRHIPLPIPPPPSTGSNDKGDGRIPHHPARAWGAPDKEEDAAAGGRGGAVGEGDRGATTGGSDSTVRRGSNDSGEPALQHLYARAGDTSSRRAEEGVYSVVGAAPRIDLPPPRSGDPLALFPPADLLTWQLERSSVTILPEIGGGRFGAVHRGQHHTSGAHGHTRCAAAVAVKMLDLNAVTNSHRDQLRREFLWEARLLSQLLHPNVMRLVGVTIEDEPWRMVLELCPYGDLLEVVRSCKNMNINLTYEEMLFYITQVASGMEYLGTQRIVHRDLCARNCFLSRANAVKISHFSSTAQLQVEPEYARLQRERRLPLKWFAPEVLESGIPAFSEKSDVWAFGVTCWEIITHGKKPYREVPESTLLSHLKSGKRLPKPPNAEDELADVLTDCWSAKPADRPTFQTLMRQVCAVCVLCALCLCCVCSVVLCCARFFDNSLHTSSFGVGMCSFLISKMRLTMTTGDQCETLGSSSRRSSRRRRS
jgi:serine/threonine protein kinase